MLLGRALCLGLVVLFGWAAAETQTLEDALAGLQAVREEPVGKDTVNCLSVKYFLRNPGYLTEERIVALYLAGSRHGRACVAYLALRVNPRSAPREFFRHQAKNQQLTDEERYLCYRAYWELGGYWLNVRGDRGVRVNVSEELRERVDALFDEDVEYAAGTEDRLVRAREVLGWIRDLGEVERHPTIKRGVYLRIPQTSYVRRIMRRERRTEPELLELIEEEALGGRVRWDVALRALFCSGDQERAIAFGRRNLTVACNNGGWAGVWWVFKDLGTASDIDLLSSSINTIADAKAREGIPELCRQIKKRLERERIAERQRELVEKMKAVR